MEPRYMLDKNNICYGCPLYCHYTDTEDPWFHLDYPDDIDEYGGICNTNIPCFNGELNKYKSVCKK